MSMRKKWVDGWGILAVLCALLWASSGFAIDPYSGLWVGEVNLGYVNEVSIPLDEDNHPIAPDPTLPTPTHDAAQLRLILHVNGAGQVHLLKEVAILSRSGDDSTVVSSEGDLALVTDDRLYSDFPVQDGRRIASAVFDFGDSQATRSLDAVREAVVTSVAREVAGSGVTSSSSDSDLRDAEQRAQQAAITAASPIIDNADVASSFDAFLKDNLSSSTLTTIATNDPLNLVALRTEAEGLRDRSFYGDSRAVDLLDDLESAITNAPNAAAKDAVAHAIVARYVDAENLYQHFVTGHSFNQMIVDASMTAAAAAVTNGGTEALIREAVDLVADELKIEALQVKVSSYNDTAAPDAVVQVTEAMITTAALYIGQSNIVEAVVQTGIEAVGLSTLAHEVPRYLLAIQAPTTDYNDFIHSEVFLNAAEEATASAVVQTVAAAREDPFYGEQSLSIPARIAATEGLRSAYQAAARARLTELPMNGQLAVGQGDSRLIAAIGNGMPLGAAALQATIYLPASHPTNPFRHRRHPDHTQGFDITRHIRLDFSTNALVRTGVGLDQISGVYREEIFGLHKSLGPQPNSNPIGLNVEGTFELNRISRMDTLNSR